MKLKLVVASMGILGLVSTPLFAANLKGSDPHSGVSQAQLTTLKTNVDKMHYALLTMNRMSQNCGRMYSTPNWFNKIRVNGGINFDGRWFNRSMYYYGVNNARFALNDAYLNFRADVHPMVKAFVSLSYDNVSDRPYYDEDYDSRGYKGGQYSSNANTGSLNLDQAYITIKPNIAKWPVFLQVGKQYMDFGRYTLHPVTRSVTQVLSESNQTAVELGLINKGGFHGSIYTFESPLVKAGESVKPMNYGAALGYRGKVSGIKYNVGTSYMYNIIGVSDVAEILANPVHNGNFEHRVGVVSLYGGIASGPFDLAATYVKALQRFSNVDIVKNEEHDDVGAQPWAADVTAGYNFKLANRANRAYVGYQATGDSVYLYLPASRFTAGYNIDVYKNTNLGVEWTHTRDYATLRGGTSDDVNTIAARVSVKFG